MGVDELAVLLLQLRVADLGGVGFLCRGERPSVAAARAIHTPLGTTGHCRAPTLGLDTESLGSVTVLLHPLQPLQLIPQLLVVHQRLLLLLALLLHLSLQAVHLSLQLGDVALCLWGHRALGLGPALPKTPTHLPLLQFGQSSRGMPRKALPFTPAATLSLLIKSGQQGRGPTCLHPIRSHLLALGEVPKHSTGCQDPTPAASLQGFHTTASKPIPFSHPSCSPARLYLQFNLLHLCTERVQLLLEALDLCIPVDKSRLVPGGSSPSPLPAPPYLSSHTPLGGPKVCSNRSEVIWGGQRVLS